jgi:tetratricopeptide (TPR) repeat protein
MNAPRVSTNSAKPLSAEVPSVKTNSTPEHPQEAVAISTNSLPTLSAPQASANPTAQEINASVSVSTNAAPVMINTVADATNPPPAIREPVPALMLNDTNDLVAAGLAEPENISQLRSTLEDARHLRLMRQPQTAEPILVNLLLEGNPEIIQQSALLELALVAQDENNLARAQQIYGQFVARWPNDRRAPEIFLHEGQLFRQMGLNSMALAKFYSVMTAAISVKNDQLAYYQKLVLDAQMEIAETHYQSGRFEEAADFFSRLLKQNSPALNHPEIQFRLIRSLQASGNPSETSAQAFDFLSRFPNSPNEPEVRFCLAVALKDLGRNSESLQQVLALLKKEKAQSKDHPEVWAYWQQRTGNEIANQLYRDGDFPKALDVYLSLEQLDRSAAWQLPLRYQIGMTYERLLQPQMAMQSYSNIVNRQADLGTNASPGLKALVDMANWRINFIQWQSKADNVNKALSTPATEKTASKKPAPTRTALP